jgi:hypothetical protein
MALQNRVTPFGAIEAHPGRACTLMGNRGRIHRADRTLGRRRFASLAWTACELRYKQQYHEPMGAGYTALFFLDEVTALAAGHRPCFWCRRAEARAFVGNRRASDFDQVLHAQRLRPQPCRVDHLPDGAMVAVEGLAYAVRGEALLAWSHSGYGAAIRRTAHPHAALLTPPLTIAILKSGYQPRWHHTVEGGHLS